MTAVLAASIEGNVIGLLIFAAVALINWIAQSKAAKKAKEPQDLKSEAPPPRSVSPDQPDPEQERLRKFLEALGIPQDEAPPPRRMSPERVNPPPLPKVRADLPARGKPRAEVKPQRPARRIEPVSVPESAFQPPPQPVFAAAIETVTLTDDLKNYEAAAFSYESLHADSDTPRRDQPSRAARLLPSSAELRKAIVLREILGAPRGLQSLDSIV
ncbi:MAG: hypothetical protein ABI680_20220 [Chthoniobacteraceae bacterium]